MLRAISPVNGKENWSTKLFFAHNIIRSLFLDEKLFISGSGFPFIVIDPVNGKIIKSYTSIDSFRAEYPNTPFYPSSSEVFDPIILGEDVIRTEGSDQFSISRMHINRYKKGWEIEQDSISNPALIENVLFYISRDDRLKAVDVNTRELIFETTIQPSIGFFDMEKDSQHDGYYVCSDEEEKILYIILGDSRQLFAFTIIK